MASAASGRALSRNAQTASSPSFVVRDTNRCFAHASSSTLIAYGCQQGSVARMLARARTVYRFQMQLADKTLCNPPFLFFNYDFRGFGMKTYVRVLQTRGSCQRSWCTRASCAQTPQRFLIKVGKIYREAFAMIQQNILQKIFLINSV